LVNTKRGTKIDHIEINMRRELCDQLNEKRLRQEHAKLTFGLDKNENTVK
jgi:hypothetical protein